jgi:uncharacterized membrane protein YeaQ/YmgE (transglycosylase-associated protein family)
VINFVAWVVAGGLLGYGVSRRLSGDKTPDALLNILAGVVGGFGSGLAIQAALYALDPRMTRVSLWALLSALAGAGLLLLVVNFPVRALAEVRWLRRRRRSD